MDKYIALLARLLLMDYALNHTQRDMVLIEILDAIEEDNDPQTTEELIKWAQKRKAQRDEAIETWRSEHKSEKAQTETPFLKWRKQHSASVQRTGTNTKEKA